jgi:hypothetical protein
LRQVLTIVENARLYNRLQGTYLEMEQKNNQLLQSQSELRRQVVPLFVVLGLVTPAVEEQDEWISSALLEEWSIVGGSVDTRVEDPQCYRRAFFPHAEVLDPEEHRRQHAGLPADVASLFRRVAAPPLYTAGVPRTNVAASAAVDRVVAQIGVTDPVAAAQFLSTADASAAPVAGTLSAGRLHLTALPPPAAYIPTAVTGGGPTGNGGETYRGDPAVIS